MRTAFSRSAAFAALLALSSTAALHAQSPLCTPTAPPWASNNGGTAGGVVFYDLNVASAVRITGFDCNLSTANANVSLELYIKPTTYVGSQTVPAAWTLSGTAGPVTSAPAINQPTTFVLASPVILTAGQYGVGYRVIGSGQRYTGTGAGVQVTTTRTEMTLTSGAAISGLFTGSLFSFRNWNGCIHYTGATGLFPNFSATPTSGPSPLNVQFTDTTFSSDPGGVTSWAWDLDGDTIVDSNAQNPAFTYNTCGRYNVSLTVTDASNPQASTTKNQFITVDPQLLVTASFTVANAGALSRQFTDTSTGSPSVWSWDFDGDNIPDSAQQNPSFTYPAGGTYTVTLNASNACGAGTSTRQVVVITNDDCAGAIPAVAGLNGPFSNVGATSSLSFNCGGTTDNDVWFSYTPSCNVAVEINTCATLPSFDTKISVHSGTCGALTQLACNDDSCGLLSRVSGVAMTGGQTYYIAIGGFNGATGSFVFDLIASATGAGAFTTVSPGCGGTGLTAAGNPNIGGSATFTMAPVQGLPFINLGIIPLGVPICAGGCVLGATLDATYPGASFGGPIPCDPLLIGATVYTQGIDLGAAGGCAANDPLLLTLSDTIRTVIG
ncbi:MAG: PKD domain-containing protein [Planctomycetes bacterium]|nr:PKD domain-containing protein [Planctomycetota bacterium]